MTTNDSALNALSNALTAADSPTQRVSADITSDFPPAEHLTPMLSLANSYNAEDLRDYYKSVGEHFDQRLQELIDSLPNDVKERSQLISQSLEKMNPILKKLDEDLALHLYRDYLSFAKHVARASGGFLTFGSISSEEKKLIKLSMIQRPVHY